MSAQHLTDEQRDVPPFSVDLVFWLGALVVVLAIAVGVLLGSFVLHTFDAEIRAALFWVGRLLQRLYWAWATVNF